MRKTVPAFQEGKQVMLDTDNNQVLSSLRYAPGHPAVVVACNFTAMTQSLKFDLTKQGIHSKNAITIAKTPNLNDPSSLDNVTLPPFGIYVGEVQYLSGWPTQASFAGVGNPLTPILGWPLTLPWLSG